ncbi:hypothetical protein VKT23_009195 [Stygiomarasmius scandens]|uniref:Uncharacterized protein n=1 Tax=Marasmiellus scandens TaxID=2682957 RepID=A0ABR1JH98_9AGAR
MDESLKWFDMFHIIFELVSAFGTIGLSLGIPTDNFSFSGALRPLSKLVVILIMVRGRHRGLPVRVDRAIMLPRELVKRDQSPAGLHSGEPEHRQQLPQDLSLSDQEERTDSYAE